MEEKSRRRLTIGAPQGRLISQRACQGQGVVIHVTGSAESGLDQVWVVRSLKPGRRGKSAAAEVVQCLTDR